MEYQPSEVNSLDLITNDVVYNAEKIGKMFMDFVKEYKTTHKPYFHLLHNNLLQNIWTMKIKIEHINQFLPELYEQLVRMPEKTLESFETAICREFNAPRFQIQLISGSGFTRIREINASQSNKIVRIEGIAISCSKIVTKPKELYITCRNCLSSRTVRDVVPRNCDKPGCPVDPYVVIPEKCVVGDIQYVKLQENFEDIPEGETPRNIGLEIEGELVDKIIPGNVIRVTGIYKIRSGRDIVSCVKVLGIENRSNKISMVFTEEEESLFKEIANTTRKENIIKDSNKSDFTKYNQGNFQCKGVYEIIAKSIAPGIFGNEDLKKALACLLFGGTRRIKEDGINLRGDINILLLGDPGIAKSQLLKCVEKLAPTGVYTSGKGSSAAGLTAAVMKDYKGNWTLEAGALVLANGGVCCIDEFDKMSLRDQVAIHEAMEQQVISIAKAGITTVLNTRTAILAAANPVFGRYDDYKTPGDNIEFGTTILSRFDCIFILKDNFSARDKKLADFVVNLHVGKKERRRSTYDPMAESSEEEIHKSSNVENRDIIPPDVLRRYIQYAREKVFPSLSKEAAERLEKFYVSMREEVRSLSATDKGKTKTAPIPVTVRQLEALVRISEALAKMELNSIVTVNHVEEAIRIFQLSTMNAVAQGHAIEGMVRPSFFNELNDVITRINQVIPVGTSKKFSDLVKDLGVKESILKKAVDYLVKQNKIISRDYGRILIRVP